MKRSKMQSKKPPRAPFDSASLRSGRSLLSPTLKRETSEKRGSMKLVIAIVRDTDAGAVIEQLVSHGHRVTRVASTGGFLRRGNVTLLIGVEEQHLQAVFDILKDTCRSPEPGQCRATIFVVNASHFEQI